MTAAELFPQWLEAFVLTVAIEVPIYGLIIGRGVPWPKRLLVAFLLQAATHPALWFVIPDHRTCGMSYAAWVVVAELGVVAVEAGLLATALRWWLKQPRPLAVACLAAVAANAVSTWIGLALYL